MIFSLVLKWLERGLVVLVSDWKFCWGLLEGFCCLLRELWVIIGIDKGLKVEVVGESFWFNVDLEGVVLLEMNGFFLVIGVILLKCFVDFWWNNEWLVGLLRFMLVMLVYSLFDLVELLLGEKVVKWVLGVLLCLYEFVVLFEEWGEDGLNVLLWDCVIVMIWKN